MDLILDNVCWEICVSLAPQIWSSGLADENHFSCCLHFAMSCNLQTRMQFWRPARPEPWDSWGEWWGILVNLANMGGCIYHNSMSSKKEFDFFLGLFCGPNIFGGKEKAKANIINNQDHWHP